MTITEARGVKFEKGVFHIDPDPAPAIETVEELPAWGVTNLVCSPEGTKSLHRSEVLMDGMALRMKCVLGIQECGSGPNPVQISIDITEELQHALRMVDPGLMLEYAEAAAAMDANDSVDEEGRRISWDSLAEAADIAWFAVVNDIGGELYTSTRINLSPRLGRALRDRVSVVVELAEDRATEVGE